MTEIPGIFSPYEVLPDVSRILCSGRHLRPARRCRYPEKRLPRGMASIHLDGLGLRVRREPLSGQSEIPGIAALHRTGSATVRAVLDLHHAISRDRSNSEVVISFFFRTEGGQVFSEFRHGRLQMIRPNSTSISQKGASPLAEKTYNQERRKPDVRLTSIGRRTDELDLYMDWSGYPTGCTTSAEYLSNRAHSRAGPTVE